MASQIGRRGTNKGPSRTSMAGSRSSGNLGSATTNNKGANQNRDVTTAFKRRGINPGPGGHQRPSA